MAKLYWAPKIQFGKFYLTANVPSIHPLYWGHVNGIDCWVYNADAAFFYDTIDDAWAVLDRLEKSPGPEINLNQVPTEAQWRKQQGA